MNIEYLIEDALSILENNSAKLSMIYPKISRIAHYLNDVEEVFWINFNSIEFTSIKDPSVKSKLDSIFVGCSNDLKKDIEEKTIKEYLSLRSFKPYDIMNQKYEEDITIQSIPVMMIENQIDLMEQNLSSNSITGRDGNASLNSNDQVKIEFGLRINHKLYTDIISKLKIHATSYLVDAEHRLLSSKEVKITGVKKNKNVFIIHGHNVILRQELQLMLTNDFKLNPVILSDMPDKGLTIVEKFETYASDCSYAIALFTPDDVVEKNGEKYFQARPNVIFELGWFCAALSRSGVCIVFQDGSNMDIFSDFQGVVQKRFQKNLKEIYRDIRMELVDSGMIK